MPDSTCRWTDCERKATTKGFCPRDYQRSKRLGNFEDPWKTWAPVKVSYESCRWPECPLTLIKGHGLCRIHYRRSVDVGTFQDPWDLWVPGGHCVVCGTWSEGTIRNQRFCSMECNLADWNRRNPGRKRVTDREHVRRRRARILATQTDRFTDKDVRMAHGDICYLCDEKINFRLRFPNPKSPSLDHVIPLSRGGTHTLDNAAMVHYVCNQKKGVKAAPKPPQPTLLAT
jgi:predicted nucleic acid-binding Zn ribbon protein